MIYIRRQRKSYKKICSLKLLVNFGTQQRASLHTPFQVRPPTCGIYIGSDSDLLHLLWYAGGGEGGAYKMLPVTFNSIKLSDTSHSLGPSPTPPYPPIWPSPHLLHSPHLTRWTPNPYLTRSTPPTPYLTCCTPCTRYSYSLDALPHPFTPLAGLPCHLAGLPRPLAGLPPSLAGFPLTPLFGLRPYFARWIPPPPPPFLPYSLDSPFYRALWTSPLLRSLDSLLPHSLDSTTAPPPPLAYPTRIPPTRAKTRPPRNRPKNYLYQALSGYQPIDSGIGGCCLYGLVSICICPIEWYNLPCTIYRRL